MNDLLYDIEIPLSMLLSKMESVGVSIDAVLMDEYLRKVESRIAEITTRAREMTSQPALNLGSSDQVSRLLYDHLKLPLPSQHTGTSGSKARKHPSTSEAELNRLLDKHPVVELILTYRALSRVQTSTIEGIKTFLVEYGKGAQPLSKPLPSFMNRSRESDVMAGPVYRLHAWWNQTNAATGRLSCSKPNLQAIPTAKSIDNVEMDLRSLFVASPG
jgi:DNA polymerase-1